MLRSRLLLRVLRGPVLALAVLMSPPVAAQGARPAVEIPTVGEFKGLVAFVRFADEAPDACGRPLDWPHDRAMPASGPRYLAGSPEPPFDPGSLTAFFHAQSRGHFVLWGEEFAVGLDSVHHYTVGDGPRAGRLDERRITREVLRALDDAVDFRDYDANGDGYLDHAFIVLRSTMGRPSYAASGGISQLFFSHDGAADLDGDGAPDFDGVRISDAFSGSLNGYGSIDPELGAVGLLAHEFGHDLWNHNGYFSNHLMGVLGNGVPTAYEGDEVVPPAQADGVLGYALMINGGPGRNVVNLHASAAERALLSLDLPPDRRWIACPELAHGTTHTLGGLYGTGDCRRLTLEDTARGGRHGTSVTELYVSNLVRDSPFTALRTGLSDGAGAYRDSLAYRNCPGCGEGGGPTTVELGLPVTGLAVELLVRGRTRPYRARRDVIPADGDLAVAHLCDDFVPGRGRELADLHRGDLFGPGAAVQLSPWTRPNSYGHATAASVPDAYFARGWPVLDDVRGEAGGALTFDYYDDPFALDTFYVRADSWVGAETAGRAFAGAVRVTRGATLTVEDGATLAVRGGLVVEPGGRLVLEGTGAVRGAVTVAAGGAVVRAPAPPATGRTSADPADRR